MDTPDLVTAWRTKADDYMRISKAYNCRSNSSIRTAYVKTALQLRECADELDASLSRAEVQPEHEEAVLDGTLAGDPGHAAPQGTAMPTLPINWQDHGGNGL